MNNKIYILTLIVLTCAVMLLDSFPLVAVLLVYVCGVSMGLNVKKI